MVSIYTTLAIIGMVFILPVIIPALFLGALFYDFLNSELPPGIDQPLKLRFFHSLLITTMISGKILEKLGICSDLSLLRVVLDGIPPRRDSKLLIKDLKVDEVPLRIYQPKQPPTGKRRGILYFHGGAGTFGSISKKSKGRQSFDCLGSCWLSLPTVLDLFLSNQVYGCFVWKPRHLTWKSRFHSRGQTGKFVGFESFTVSKGAFERICRYIAKKCNSVVVSVGYRLSPEHPYPGQYFDCLNATLYFMRNLEEYHVDPALIIISGDSCGANFATVICQILLNKRDLPKVRAQVLLYPGLQGLDFHLPSYQQNASVPILFRKLVIYFCFRYLNKEPSVLEDVLQNCHVPESMKRKYKKWISADIIPDKFKIRGYVPQKSTSYKPEVHEAVKELLAITFSPLLAEDSIICQLPESYIVTCQFDVLRDDGLLYKKRLEDNGVQVTWYHSESGFHGILAFFGYGIFSFSSGKKIMDSTVNYINSL